MKTRAIFVHIVLMFLFILSPGIASAADVILTGSAMANGTGTSISVTHGLSIEANDVVLAFIHVNGNQRVTDNNGAASFTEVIDQAGPDTNGHAIYSRIASSSEPAAYGWTKPGSDRWSVEIRVFKNVNTSNIWDVVPSASSRASGNGVTATAPSVTINTSGAMGIAFVFSDTSVQGFSNPTNGYGNELEASGQPQTTYTRTWPAAGSTGAISVTLSSTNDWMAYQIALRTVVVSGPDTTPPIRANGQPSGSLPAGTTSTTLSLTTDESATCRYSTTPNTAYASMANTFAITGGTSHSTSISGLANGNTYNRYVRCADGSNNQNANDFTITFSVAQPNAGAFQNETLLSGLELPTNFEFLPDGTMLIGEFQSGRIWALLPNATQVEPTPFNHITNIGTVEEQGLLDILIHPNFASNRFYYVFYTAGSPNRDRISRFTANAGGTSTIPGSEVVIWQDTVTAGPGHHGGQMDFGPDGKLYLAMGEHRVPNDAQLLTTAHGKVLRINADGTIPTDNPFYDGAGPNVDAIWARGLRNPFRASFDDATGNYYIADVGQESREEINLGVAGANYGWPVCEGPCATQGMTSPIYSYTHQGRDASITGGFVYRGNQFPSEYYGNYFFGDYAQNWIKRLTLSPDGRTVTGVFNFDPPNGAADGPTGDIVYLAQGPDGALYYSDLGFSDVNGGQVFGVSKIRRIRYSQSNQAPVALISASPTTGSPALTVNFSSNGSYDPENQGLSYSWTFGDGASSTAANPVHVYQQSGIYSARLALSDGVVTTISNPISITVGTPPTATILTPANNTFFVAGDVITFSGQATDGAGNPLGAGAFTWDVYFLHDTHFHPSAHLVNSTSGTLQVPTSGHDWAGNTRYEIILKVTDSNGLSATTSVFAWPQKVNLNFNTSPSGFTVKVDGVTRTAPFVHETLVGFNHVIEAANQTQGGNTYSFVSWSDGGAQQHTIVVPNSATSYGATYQIQQNSAVTLAGSAVANGTGTAIAVTHGLNIQANDVVLAFIHVNGNQRVTDNNGGSSFTEVIDQAGPDTNGHAIYGRIAGPSEPATYRWTRTGSEKWSVEIRVFKNVNTSNIWDVGPSASTRASGNGTTATAPAVTITTPGAMGIVFVFSDTAVQSFSNPTNGYGNELEASGQPQATYTRTWQSAGATGPARVTLSSSNDWMAYQIALKPAP